jgi:hypothetical protein
VSPEAAEWFPEIAGFKIFRIPLSPRSQKARLYSTRLKEKIRRQVSPVRFRRPPPQAVDESYASAVSERLYIMHRLAARVLISQAD